MSERLSAPGRLSLLSRRTPGLARALSRAHARVYRATGGRGVGRWFGVPLAIIETVGRRSGKPRRTPVIYVELDGERVLVMASNGGAQSPPAWWLNLSAAGRGRLTVHGVTREVVPRVAEGAERQELWGVFARAYPAIDEYTLFTDREFPLVVLSPAGSAGGERVE